MAEKREMRKVLAEKGKNHEERRERERQTVEE
jgi:hypothetical protein